MSSHNNAAQQDWETSGALTTFYGVQALLRHVGLGDELGTLGQKAHGSLALHIEENINIREDREHTQLHW